MTSSTPRAGAVVGVVECGARAVVVTVAPGGTLLARRTIVLVDPPLPTHPHHHEGSWAVGRYLSTPGARPLPLAEAVSLVERVRDFARARAGAGLAALADDLAAPVGAIVLRDCPELPASVEARIRDHRAQTLADSVMYRQVLADAARERGWTVHWYDRAQAFDRAAAVWPDVDVRAHVAAMGRSCGPPWRADHRLAAAAAMVHLR